ncbi:uncharacterized protein A4U43_C08F31450 [Asparagus officinalis]|nr:uncharacterized protein A4U43_C08F31450 [Asparagus officinalis]
MGSGTSKDPSPATSGPRRPRSRAFGASCFGLSSSPPRDPGGEIYRVPDKGGDGLHAVIVGYGVKDVINYWKIMNSWGMQWGDDDYGLIC